MNIQETKQHILNGWRRKFTPEEIPAIRHDLHSLVEATKQEYKLLSPSDINGIMVSLEWILNKANFECDCEPIHEWDTNATTHSDNCALSMMDHTEAVLDTLRRLERE